MGEAYEGIVFHDALFENPGMYPDASWIVLELEGVTSNRSAIGARVQIQTVGVNGTRQSFFHVVGTGGSFGSSSLQIEAGLGAEQLSK